MMDKMLLLAIKHLAKDTCPPMFLPRCDFPELIGGKFNA